MLQAVEVYGIRICAEQIFFHSKVERLIHMRDLHGFCSVAVEEGFVVEKTPARVQNTVNRIQRMPGRDPRALARRRACDFQMQFSISRGEISKKSVFQAFFAVHSCYFACKAAPP